MADDDWLRHPGIAPPPSVRLEPEYRDDYRRWHAERSPEAATALVGRLGPVVGSGLKAFGGPAPSPTTRAAARRLTLHAVRTYDPAGSPLRDHVLRHLQGLQRLAPREARLLSVPDRVVLDRQRLDAATASLRDELGREPTTPELADRTMLPLRRIALVRQYRPGIAQGQAEAARAGGDDDGGPGGEGAVARPDPVAAKYEFLRDDLGPIDQAILEHTLGLYGRERLGPSEIARRLGRSPGAISQRTARLQQAFDRLDDLQLF